MAGTQVPSDGVAHSIHLTFASNVNDLNPVKLTLLKFHLYCNFFLVMFVQKLVYVAWHSMAKPSWHLGRLVQQVTVLCP